jgi:hypothetical protein
MRYVSHGNRVATCSRMVHYSVRKLTFKHDSLNIILNLRWVICSWRNANAQVMYKIYRTDISSSEQSKVLDIQTASVGSFTIQLTCFSWNLLFMYLNCTVKNNLSCFASYCLFICPLYKSHLPFLAHLLLITMINAEKLKMSSTAGANYL